MVTIFRGFAPLARQAQANFNNGLLRLDQWRAAPSSRVEKPLSRPTQAYKGTVKWFSKEKGYGFLTPDATVNPQTGLKVQGQDAFVHYEQIVTNGFRSLEEGQRVEFEVKKGLRYPITAVRVVGL